MLLGIGARRLAFLGLGLGCSEKCNVGYTGGMLSNGENQC
jgi:hypothetical protein